MIPKGMTPKKIAQEFILDAIDSKCSSSDPYWFLDDSSALTKTEQQKISEQTDKLVRRLQKQYGLVGDGKGTKININKNAKPSCEGD